MNTTKGLLGAVAGLATGAVLGILFAPDKGSVTRKKIIDKGKDYGNDLKSEYKKSATSITENLAKEAQEFAQKGKTKFDEIKKDVNSDKSNLKL